MQMLSNFCRIVFKLSNCCRITSNCGRIFIVVSNCCRIEAELCRTVVEIVSNCSRIVIEILSSYCRVDVRLSWSVFEVIPSLCRILSNCFPVDVKLSNFCRNFVELLSIWPCMYFSFFAVSLSSCWNVVELCRPVLELLSNSPNVIYFLSNCYPFVQLL